MLTLRHVIIGLALWVAMTADSAGHSQRQSPQDHQPEKPQQTQQHAAPDQRGTEQSPFIIRTLPSPSDEAKAAEKAKERKEKTELDTKLVNFNGELSFYTMLLASFAAFQLIAMVTQAYSLHRTVKVSERAADAAQNSADAVVSQLRAYISYGAIVNRDQDPVVVVVTLQNSGQTPAYGFRIKTVARTFNPGQDHDFTFPEVELFSKGDIPPSGIAQTTHNLRPFPSQQELFVFGRAEYRTAFKQNIIQDFRFVAGGSHGFSSDGRMIMAPEGNKETES